MIQIRNVVSLCLLILFQTLISASLFGQLKINTGEIAGVVSDPAGARIAGAHIVVTDAARGSQWQTTSDATGTYRLLLLPPSRYTLEIDASGFSKRRIAPVDLLVGEVASLNIRLDVSRVQTEVTVQTPPGVLDLQRSYPTDAVEAERIELLPINRRNYLDFAVLTPGVAETNVLADAADFRLAVSPTSGLGFAGLNGRGNSFSIDGISNDGASGNVRPSVPQAAVQEFQVNRNSYSVEYGGGYGGATNIVTKSGTNAWRGSVFGYLRNRDIQARNYFDPEKSAYTRVQSGAEAGGALRPDKTFIFGAFERLDRHESIFVPILEDPGVISRLTPSQQQIVSFAERSGSPVLQSTAALMQQLLIPTNNPTVRPLFMTNSGVFPFDAGVNQTSVRLDHHFSAQDSAFLRANFTRDTQDNTRLGALVGVSHGSLTRWTDATLVGSNTNYFNSSWMGVTRFGFGNTRFNIKPNEPFGPELIINGFGTFGRDSVFPYRQHETYIEAQQSFAYSSGKHNLRFGIDINPIRSALDLETFFGGRFVFGEFLPLGLILGLATQNTGYAANVASELVRLGRPELAEGLATPINSLQAYALNLPIFYLQGFGNPRVQRWRHHYSSFVEDAYSIRPGLTLTGGLRQQTDKNPNFPDRTYVVPRAGLAWTPVAGDSLVIRAGSGLFVAWVDLNATLSAYEIMRKDKSLLFVPLTGIPTLNPATGQPVNSADIYGSLVRNNVIGHRAITFSDLTPLGIGPGFPPIATGGFEPGYTSPYTTQASLEIERSFAGTVVSASYNFSRAAHLWRARDHNLIQTGTRPDGWPIFGLRDPSIVNNWIIESSGNSFYHGLTLQLNRRFRGWYGVNAHYTWSKAIDDVTDFNPDYAAHNQLDLRGERGLSLFNHAHRFVLSSVLTTSSTKTILQNWTFSTIVKATSGGSFNVLTGFDNLGDGQPNTHRPLGLGRNVGHGPNFFSFDARIGRKFNVGADPGRSLEITAEAFNLFNRTNFQSVNNIVGTLPIQALGNPIVGHRGRPTDPLSFVSAYDPRQFQIGLKLGL